MVDSLAFQRQKNYINARPAVTRHVGNLIDRAITLRFTLGEPGDLAKLRFPFTKRLPNEMVVCGH